jgi:hypothetical protein
MRAGVFVKKIIFSSNIEDLVKVFGVERVSKASLFHIKHSNEVKQQNQFLVFSKIDGIGQNKEGLYLRTKSSVLFTDTANKSYLAFGQVAGAKVVCVDDDPLLPDASGWFFSHINKTWEIGDLTRVSIKLPEGGELRPDSFSLSFFPSAVLSPKSDDKNLCLK